MYIDVFRKATPCRINNGVFLRVIGTGADCYCEQPA